jgi:hypothetical protein
MNNREKLFFKNVDLYRSMSLRKKMDKQEVDKQRQRYAKEYMEQMKKKKKKKTLMSWIMKIFV